MRCFHPFYAAPSRHRFPPPPFHPWTCVLPLTPSASTVLIATNVVWLKKTIAEKNYKEAERRAKDLEVLCPFLRNAELLRANAWKGGEGREGRDDSCTCYQQLFFFADFASPAGQTRHRAGQDLSSRAQTLVRFFASSCPRPAVSECHLLSPYHIFTTSLFIIYTNSRDSFGNAPIIRQGSGQSS